MSGRLTFICVLEAILPELCPERTTLAAAKVDRAVLSLLSKADWSWSYVSTVDSRGRTIFVADARRDDGKRFTVPVDEKLAAFSRI